MNAEADRRITALQFQQADRTGDWRVLGSGASTWYAAPSHSAGAALARRILALTQECVGPLPDGASLPIDLDIRADGVRVRIPLTPEDGGFRPDHSALAETVSSAAAELGLPADPVAVQDVQLAFDVLDQESVSSFWETALGYRRVGDEDVMDPVRRHPLIWFQDMDAPRPLRNRLHLDVVTPEPVASTAVNALEALGGHAARHGYYATVADPEGNEVDVLPLEVGADRWHGDRTEDWRLVFAAMACYPVADAHQAGELATKAAELADEAHLPVRIDLRPGVVVIDTGKDRWETEEGYEALAARVQEVARDLGLVADVTLPRFVQVGIDAVDIPAVRRFWCAALGYEPDPRPHVTDIVDPRQLNPVLFFQDLDASDDARRAQRNRIHLDVFVPHDQAEARIEAALAAGGRLVYEDEAPDFVTLADPEGNEVDIAVSVGREERWQAAHPA
ncbi:VOC family protein [Ornithinimicrobium pratense]|uniref:VOC family protein n=1 Tax=Ornithinimicrobium pratense TaxID=2593973 RepID=A0A5J6V4H0_9MICO|nr:VOC family protein [Ornithinimicrobium pratense]QFG68066.1 VOC family protein [Ornithinimicrobium pratense]